MSRIRSRTLNSTVARAFVQAGDRLLGAVLPQARAAAQSCYWHHQWCSGSNCVTYYQCVNPTECCSRASGQPFWSCRSGAC